MAISNAFADSLPYPPCCAVLSEKMQEYPECCLFKIIQSPQDLLLRFSVFRLLLKLCLRFEYPVQLY